MDLTTAPSLFPIDTTDQIAQVVVERGLDAYPDGLSYLVPTDLSDLGVGDRVIVPLGRGNKATPGYVVELGRPGQTPATNPVKLKVILKRDEGAVRLPADLIELARWMDGYYCTPRGMVLATMLPGPVRRDVGRVTRRFVDLVEPVEKTNSAPEPEIRLTKAQKRVVAALTDVLPEKRPIEIRDLAELAEVKTLGPIRRLVDHGLLTETLRSSVAATWGQAAVDTFVPNNLTDEQGRIVQAIGGELRDGFAVHLVHGVTGSGKTEIYIRLISRVVEAGKVAIMLVPEIALTPQTSGRLIGRFADERVAILHSGLTPAQRNHQWNLASSGDAAVIIGARSAVFAPVPDDRLGLIIVDEEHDSSYKQDQLPRYHGRDAAIKRAQLNECPVVLGSATPSLESWHNATATSPGSLDTRFRLHQLKHRVPGATLPQVRIVDFRDQIRQRNDPSRVHLIGPVLENEIRGTLTDNYQVLILLNRRGYANYIACPDQRCGWVMQCDDCDTTMVYHKHRDIPSGGFLRCHHCQAEQRLRKQCPLCSRRIVNFGLGTQRVEDELEAMFPSQLKTGETMLRVDSDTMQSANDFHTSLGRFARREIKLLLGTQMIAKGLDFPGVRLVGVINADTALNLPDFRAAERTFQLVSQVAGRSGRVDTAGKVIVQSFQPDAMPIRLAASHDYEAFAKAELAIRSRCNLPPITRMARIVCRNEDHIIARDAAAVLAQQLQSVAPESVRLRGPAPCPISRIAGHHRHQVELFAPDATILHRLLASARANRWIKADGEMAIDVDPVALL